MLTLSLALLVGAAPAVGSSWKWSYDDSRKMKLLSGPQGGSLKEYPHLEKTELEFTVDEVGPDAPHALTVKVLKGPPNLAGRKWKVESNYGVAALTELSKQSEQSELRDADMNLVLQRAISTLLVPDPIVAAAAADPCSEATREKIAKAAGKLAAQLVTQHADEVTTEKASAQCVGSGGKYTVAFTLTQPTQDDQKLAFPFTGTIEIPEGAWRAKVQLSCSGTVEMKTTGKPIRVQTQLGLKSVFAKK